MVIYNLKNKKIWPILKVFFVPLSLKTTRKDPTPQNGQIKNCFTKS